MLLVAAFLFAISVWVQCAEPNDASILDRVSASPELRKQLLKEYESNPQTFHDDRLLAVGIGYIDEDQLAKAQPVYERFIRDHPNHPRAYRGLGTVHYYQNHFDEAIKAYRKAWSLGDLNSLGPLAGTYVNRERFSEMQDLIPALEQNVKDNPVIVNCLILYAIHFKDPPDVKLVMKALAGLPDESFLENEDTAQVLREVMARFGSAPELELSQLPILVKVIKGYQSDPKKWPANRRIYVADAYNLTGQFAKGETLYREILKDIPDDMPALRGLGISLAYQHHFKEGEAILRKTWDRGDKHSLTALTACSLAARDFDGMADLIPALMEQRKNNMQLLNSVVMYALGRQPADQKLFFNAIEGLSDEQILWNEELTHNVILGLKRFGDQKRAEKLERLKADQDRGKKV